MKKTIIAGCLLLGLNAAFAANDNGPVSTKQSTVQSNNYQDSSYQRRKYPDSTGRSKNNNGNWKKGNKMKGQKGMSDSMHHGMSGTDSTKQ